MGEFQGEILGQRYDLARLAMLHGLNRKRFLAPVRRLILPEPELCAAIGPIEIMRVAASPRQ
jgi:hypothetical protein